MLGSNMPSIETLAVAFKKCDVNNNGFIEREELGEVLKVAGVTQTRGEFLETLEVVTLPRVCHVPAAAFVTTRT